MAEKYNRMLKAGIPKQGVEQAMRQDGCELLFYLFWRFGNC